LLETVQLVNKRLNPKLRIGGIVLTMFDSQTKLSNEVVAELENFIVEARGRNLPWSDAIIFDTRIRRNIKLAESPSFGQTIMAYDSKSAGAADYRALAKEVAGMDARTVAPPASAIDRPKIEVVISPSVSGSSLVSVAKPASGEVAA
jgi:chromosome partitioning protein